MSETPQRQASLAEIKAMIGNGPRREPAYYSKLEGKTTYVTSSLLHRYVTAALNSRASQGHRLAEQCC